MGAEKHYAGRWICQKPAGKCKGLFSVYGVKLPCPLAGKCLGSEHEDGQLERYWPYGRYGKLLIQSEEDWNKKHMERRRRAEWAFARDAMNAYHRGYREEHREVINQRHRTRYDPPLEALAPGYVPRGVKPKAEPPCGGDCRNCPYDECRYEDWEDPDERKRREQSAKRDRAKERQRQKERMEADPEYAEKVRAKRREYTRRLRERKKQLMKGRT